MRLSPKDEEKISILKERYGILLNSEIIRLALSIATTDIVRDMPSSPSSQPLASETQRKNPI
jgi:hypothetical protein